MTRYETTLTWQGSLVYVNFLLCTIRPEPLTLGFAFISEASLERPDTSFCNEALPKTRPLAAWYHVLSTDATSAADAGDSSCPVHDVAKALNEHHHSSWDPASGRRLLSPGSYTAFHCNHVSHSHVHLERCLSSEIHRSSCSLIFYRTAFVYKIS